MISRLEKKFRISGTMFFCFFQLGDGFQSSSDFQYVALPLITKEKCTKPYTVYNSSRVTHFWGHFWGHFRGKIFAKILRDNSGDNLGDNKGNNLGEDFDDNCEDNCLKKFVDNDIKTREKVQNIRPNVYCFVFFN